MNKKEKFLEKLNAMGIFYTENAYDQVTVDRTSIWLGKEKWYDQVTQTKGVGINSFFKHIMKEL